MSPSRFPNGRHLVYADLSAEEYRAVKRIADRDGLSIADFTRRSINSALLEEGDQTLLIRERRRSKTETARGAHE